MSCFRFLLFLLFLFSFSIQGEEKSLEKQYFNLKELSDFEIKWYSKNLSTMEEEPLFSQAPRKEKETYRFLWLRTRHQPVMVRIEKDGARYSLYLKVLSGLGGYDPGKLIIDKNFSIKEKDWKYFKELLEKSTYWQLPTNEKVNGRDGAEWILEAKSADKYHVVNRWSPYGRDTSGGTKEFADACSFLLKLTGKSFKPIY